MDRVRVLIERNIGYLCQALRLAQSLDDAVYTATGPGFEHGPVGTQLRHIVDCYDCFLRGLPEAHVDYDGRRRDNRVETDRAVAVNRLGAIVDDLDRLELDPQAAGALTVSADAVDGEPSRTPSSVERELLFLMSHTIHHFAVIALVLTAQGVRVDGDFGVAPSTLQFWTQLTDVAN